MNGTKRPEDDYMRRMDRQLPLFGKNGQRKIASTPLSIIGFGGNGSVIALLCALIGFLKLTLCDGDRLEIHNLNRFVFGGVRDVGEYKVVIGREELESRFPGVEVNAIPEDVRAPGVWDSVRQCGWVFDATDDDEARRFVQNECAKDGISMVSVGSGFVHRDGSLVTAGSRANLVRPGSDACLMCQVLDEEPMEQSQVSLALQNMFVGTLAIDMLLRELTGYTNPGNNHAKGSTNDGSNSIASEVNFVLFDLLNRTLQTELILPGPGCQICGNWRREADKAQGMEQ